MNDKVQDVKGLRIGLLLRSDHAHHRQIALGAVEYHRANPSVQIIGENLLPLISWNHLADFQGDGLVAIANSKNELDRLQSSGVPYVLAGSRFLRPSELVVCSDNLAIGKLAAEHLLSCGLKNFLYVGGRNWDDERLRFDGFQNGLAESGFECESIELNELDFPFAKPIFELRDLELTGVHQAIKLSQEPIGLFCPNSFIARAVMGTAISVGATIPDDVAVVAVNDDPLLCETTDPPLSAIAQDSIGIGFLSMETLVAKLNGDNVGNRSLPPKRVSGRRSSDVLMVGNEFIESALRFIRDNAHHEIEISQIAKRSGVSRRTLEKRFRETLNSSPHQELLRMRMELAKSLLVDSNISITQIALRSGFGSSQVFSTVFKKQTGMTPSQYRSMEY